MYSFLTLYFCQLQFYLTYPCKHGLGVQVPYTEMWMRVSVCPNKDIHGNINVDLPKVRRKMPCCLGDPGAMCLTEKEQGQVR